MPQIKWQGKDVNSLDIRFRGIREEWSEYQLDDGSEVRVKVVMTDIMKLEDEYDPEGNPLYLFKSTNVVVVKSPDNLKRK